VSNQEVALEAHCRESHWPLGWPTSYPAYKIIHYYWYQVKLR